MSTSTFMAAKYLIPNMFISYSLSQLSELEQRVAEAESRAEGAEEKVI